VLLDVNRKFDRSRGRNEVRSKVNTAVNLSFVICQLFYLSFAKGPGAEGGKNIRRNSNRDVKLRSVVLATHYFKRERVWGAEFLQGFYVVYVVSKAPLNKSRYRDMLT
jgi:hypothetical protein